MTKLYCLYVLSCCTLFVGMQFHWYGKPAHPTHQPKQLHQPHNFAATKKSTSHSLTALTTHLHTTVTKIVNLRTQLDALEQRS